MILSWPDFEAKETCACSVPLTNTLGAGRKGAFPHDTRDAPLCPTATSHRTGPRQPPGTAEGTPAPLAPSRCPGRKTSAAEGTRAAALGVAGPDPSASLARPPNGRLPA